MTCGSVRDAGGRIRCHGDYHLGQVLVTEGDVVILDFEGEPARPLAERRAKCSPLRDVAGMLRSFSYAALTGLGAATRDATRRRRAAGAVGGALGNVGQRRLPARLSSATTGAAFLPSRATDLDALLQLFVLDKALYELGYELNNRPDWVHIPLAGLAARAVAHASACMTFQRSTALAAGARRPQQTVRIGYRRQRAWRCRPSRNSSSTS